MNDLYDKLADILVKVDKNTNIDSVIIQVYGAFLDAGWITPEHVKKTQELASQMKESLDE